jgi:DNA ligase D-like protein (predicted 3'-phosphoesterase)
MTLTTYREKRDFRRTPEPKGADVKDSQERRFVIHKHDSANPHYDLRLEIDGVLKSWVVPKGPSLDTRERRLGMPTEDHPIEYLNFEGVIPEGEYGAGPIIVWDFGSYRNLRADKEDDWSSMEAALEEGKIEFWLEGKKIEGGFALIRTDDEAEEEEERWLLVKMDDEFAEADAHVASMQQRSVISGYTTEELLEETRVAALA